MNNDVVNLERFNWRKNYKVKLSCTLTFYRKKEMTTTIVDYDGWDEGIIIRIIGNW